ncbi:hypothetical protein D3C73_1053620 [compost metagenome]
MHTKKSHIVSTRINDYLDLYNYAKLLGDAQWQQQILHILQDSSLLEEEIQFFLLQDLWKMFDNVNSKLIGLYKELKVIKDNSKAEQIKEEVWELKLQRIAITRKIYANG